MSIPLSSTGEVVAIQDADQFPAGKSQFMCGYFACAMCKSMAPVGKSPTLSAAQIIADAEQWYTQYDGTDAITNTNGMTLEQEYELLEQIGLHYQALPLNLATILAWIRLGYPVLVAVIETSVYDIALGQNPYPWTPGGTHVIVLTGVTSDGNVLARDSANCTSLYNPNSLREGPRTYRASSLQFVSATVVVPPGLPRPASATPPTAVQGEETSMIDITHPWVAIYFKEVATDPPRWSCTNGQDLFAGILAGWRAMNGAPRLPLGPEVPCGKQAVYKLCESAIILYDPLKEFDAPDGPWAPCYLLKLDSPLAQQILGAQTNSANLADAAKQVTIIEQAEAAIQKDLAPGS